MLACRWAVPVCLPSAALSAPHASSRQQRVAPSQQLERATASQQASCTRICVECIEEVKRRDLLQGILLSTAGIQLIGIGTLAADSDETVTSTRKSSVLDFAITDKVFFDIAIDKEPIGRIVVGLFGDDVPTGVKRFAELAIGKKGVSYRKKEFFKVTPSYVQNAGVRSFNVGGGAADAAHFAGGETAEALLPELEVLNKRLPVGAPKNVAGTVSIVVQDFTKPAPKTKLVARDGKFQVVEEESRPDPNGSEFAIALRDAPELDTSNLVVGKVIGGFDVLQKIGSVRVVQENSSSPYFKAAKLIGDTRAVVAERGFNRPYSKITVTRCGRLES